MHVSSKDVKTPCRDSRIAKVGKHGRDDSIKQFGMQPPLQTFFERLIAI